MLDQRLEQDFIRVTEQAALAAAKTMALTTFDLLAEPARVKAAKDEFARSK